MTTQNTGVLSGARMVTGMSGTTPMSLVPVELLQYSWRETPLPITISGANQITYTLNVSNTAPAFFVAGDDVWKVDSSVAFTWVTGAANTILNSSGVQTASQSAALGIWYMYLGIASTGAGTYTLYPSQTKPTWNPAVTSWGNQGGYMGHPGTTQTVPSGTLPGQVYIYTGFMACTSATGAGTYKAMTKLGNTYNLIADTVFATSTMTSTVLTSVNLSTLVPGHGVTVGGYVTTANAAADGISIAIDASGTGQLLFTTPAASTATFGFSGFPIPVSANPTIFAAYVGHSTTTNVQITQIVDIT